MEKQKNKHVGSMKGDTRLPQEIVRSDCNFYIMLYVSIYLLSTNLYN